MEAEHFPCDSSESDEGIDKSFTEFIGKEKVFNDNIHGQIKFPGIFSRLINSSTIQRIRNLKQLGLTYYVYPSACHNRFEHCVGTAYLAGKYGKSLQKNQPELGITDIDILCLYFAGLCHDIGHGPFSHTFEGFMHEMGNKEYSHEAMSLTLLDYLIKENDLKGDFEAENITEKDIVFIKEVILGRPLPGNEDFQGRPPCKHFLYQIVANNTTKIDVDKFDYLLRDCKQLNVTTVFDYQRLMDNSRVVGYKDGAVCDSIEENTPTIIVYRKKISDTLEDLFRSRFSMHQKAYQHRVTKVIEEMVLDGLKAADPYFEVSGSNGIKYKLSTAYKDPIAFLKLTDSIFERIQLWDDGGPKAAKIFNDIVKRNLYRFVGCFSRHVEGDLLDELCALDKKIKFIKTKINYGGGRGNPLNEVLLFEKARPNKLIKLEHSVQPEETRTFIVYCSNDDITTSCGKMSPKITGESITIERDVRLESVKKDVKKWADKHGINLEYE